MRERIKSSEPELSGVPILLGVTGSIAAYKAAELASRLSQAGAEVRAVLTAAAREFITPLTFETLTGHPVPGGMFGPGRSRGTAHITLADFPRLVVIAPVSADFIGKLAGGLADDLLSAVVMATRAPVLLAPGMNSGMWESPAVEENVRRLRKRGVEFVGPESGYLACGYEGAGRLASLEAILEAITALLSRP